MLLHPDLVLAEAAMRQRELIAEAELRRRGYAAAAASAAKGRLRGRRGRHRAAGGSAPAA